MLIVYAILDDPESESRGALTQFLVEENSTIADAIAALNELPLRGIFNCHEVKLVGIIRLEVNTDRSVPVSEVGSEWQLKDGYNDKCCLVVSDARRAADVVEEQPPPCGESQRPNRELQSLSLPPIHSGGTVQVASSPGASRQSRAVDATSAVSPSSQGEPETSEMSDGEDEENPSTQEGESGREEEYSSTEEEYTDTDEDSTPAAKSTQHQSFEVGSKHFILDRGMEYPVTIVKSPGGSHRCKIKFDGYRSQKMVETTKLLPVTKSRKRKFDALYEEMAASQKRQKRRGGGEEEEAKMLERKRERKEQQREQKREEKRKAEAQIEEAKKAAKARSKWISSDSESASLETIFPFATLQVQP